MKIQEVADGDAGRREFLSSRPGDDGCGGDGAKMERLFRVSGRKRKSFFQGLRANSLVIPSEAAFPCTKLRPPSVIA